MFCTQNDGSQNANNFFGGLNQRSELSIRHRLRFGQQAEPIEAFAGLFLRDSELVREVGAAFTCLSFFHIRAHRACSAEKLLAQNPSDSIALFL